MISKELWLRNQPSENPFLRYEFIQALLESRSIGQEAGWMPHYTHDENGILLSFAKNHSYGEYIFDWGWAEAYERYGIPYYPKLTSMIPFTPVTSSHFLMKTFDEEKASGLLNQHGEKFEVGPYSSDHFLFLPQEELKLFENHGYLIRESFQYHFFNKSYRDFEDFLSNLKTKKAKTLRHERVFTNIEFTHYTGDALTSQHAKRMYAFYISTIVNKNSYDYLNEGFFEIIFQTLRENILYIEASEDGVPVAGSLFFYDHKKLYGRYWGSSKYVDNLHFELCYYQGIDFCLRKKIEVFEAGAQGEHKISRGFKPVRTYSSHKLKHPEFQKAVRHFIDEEKIGIARAIEGLSELLPFKAISE
jgi:predicted N-acyltransferase